MLSGGGSIDQLNKKRHGTWSHSTPANRKETNICGENKYSFRLLILFDSVLDKTSVKNISI
jgi:hypothetical protein